jgi:hypothetical protein
VRGDLQAGIVAATVANANRDPDKQREPFIPANFMPNFGEEERPKGMTGEETLALMRRMMPPRQEV